MFLYNSQQWIDDIDSVMSVIPELSQLAGKSIMITGAGGLICSSIIDIIFRYNDMHDIPIHIYAADLYLEKILARFGEMTDRTDFTYVEYDAFKSDNDFPYSCDYIIHGASNAFPEKIIREPVETMLSNFLGMKYLLDMARKVKSKRVLYISSSEVYGIKDGIGKNQENEYGYIDILNPRNSYSIGKRATETLCASYAAEYKVESVIVRPGHIYGPTASPADNRVASAWSYAAARGNDIIMKSDGSQIRSYCYCLDCATAILKVLIMGENVHAYNIANPDSIISIREMAEILAHSADVGLQFQLPTKAEKRGFNPMPDSSLDSTLLLGLGWRGTFNAEEGFLHTITILKEIL